MSGDYPNTVRLQFLRLASYQIPFERLAVNRSNHQIKRNAKADPASSLSGTLSKAIQAGFLSGTLSKAVVADLLNEPIIALLCPDFELCEILNRPN